MAFNGRNHDKKTQFKPGQSGNPGGRPKIMVEVVEAARSHTMEAIATLREIMRDKKATGSARVTAALGLIERGWGKAPQTMTVKREGELKDLSDAELIAIASGAAEGVETNGGTDPAATPDDSAKPH